MIGLFNGFTSKEDVLKYNGECILDSACIKAELTTMQDNNKDEYKLSLTLITDRVIGTPTQTLLINNAILKVDIDNDFQVFRITSIDKDLDYINVVAQHITITDTMTTWIYDTRPTNLDGQMALNWLLGGLLEDLSIELISDIRTISTAYYWNMTLYDCLQNCEQCFLNRWGGYITRDKYTLKINSKKGKKVNGVIRSNYNLNGLEMTTDTSELVTMIHPVGYDGLRNMTIESPLINKYPKIFHKEIKYDDVKVKETDENGNIKEETEGFNSVNEALEELYRRARLEFSENKIDVIQTDFKINFIDLRHTIEYKDYKHLMDIDLQDTVTVIDDKFQLEIELKVISKKYDVLNQRTIEIGLSNKGSFRSSNIALEISRNINSRQNNSLSAYINKEVDNTSFAKATNGTFSNILNSDKTVNLKKVKGSVDSGIIINDKLGRFKLDNSNGEGTISYTFRSANDIKVPRLKTLEELDTPTQTYGDDDYTGVVGEASDSDLVVPNEETYYASYCNHKSFTYYHTEKITIQSQTKIDLPPNFRDLVADYHVIIEPHTFAQFLISDKNSTSFKVNASVLPFTFTYAIIGIRDYEFIGKPPVEEGPRRFNIEEEVLVNGKLQSEM